MEEIKRFISFINIDIKKCEEFKKFLEENFVLKNFHNADILIKLLNEKIYFLNSTTSHSIDRIKDKIDKQDEIIYNQILFIKNDLWKDHNDIKDNKIATDSTKYKQKIDKHIIKNIINNKHFKYYLSKQNTKTIKATNKTIFDFIINNKWLSTFSFMGIGFLFYIAYFVFNISYLPQINQGEFLYVLMISSAVGIIFVGVFSLYFLFALPMYKFAFNDVFLDENKKQCIFISSFLIIPALMCLSYHFNITSVKKLLIILFISLIIFTIFSYFLIKKQFKNSEFLKQKFTLYKIQYFIKNLSQIVSSMFIISSIIYIFVHFSNYNSVIIFIISYAVAIFITVLIYLLILEIKNIVYLITSSFIVCLIVALSLYSSEFARMFDLGNIEYKYLVMDKIAIDKIPKNIQKCITTEQNETITCMQDMNIVSYQDGDLIFNNLDKNITKKIDKSIIFNFDFTSKNQPNIKFDKIISYENKILKYVENNQTKTQKNITIKPKSKTYITQSSKNTIRLHNITALSTLGKFYYLQTQNGKKFKILSSYIQGDELKKIIIE